MKKNLLLTGLLFASILNHAQPILNAANTNMVIGEINSCTSYNWVPQGQQGANQTWNFGSITINTAGTNFNYTVATVPASITTQFPSANAILKTPNGSGGVYETSSTMLQLYGRYTPTNPNYNLVYQNPLDLLHYPFTYGSSFIDSYSGASGPTGAQEFSKATSTITADGYGTLTLPGGTFSNVLRVHLYTVGKDSISPTNQTNFTDDEYWWYLPNNHTPVVENITSDYGGVISKQFSVLNSILASVSENASIIKSFNIYPNPNNGKTLNLDLNLTENAKYEIAIIDNLGREVLKTNSDQIFEGYNFRTIDISGLESGIYNVGIILENGKSLNRKITIQK